MGFNMTDWDEADIAPAPPGGQRDAGPEVLKDGEHQLEIVKASSRDYQNKTTGDKGFILKMKLVKLDNTPPAEVSFSFDTFCTDEDSYSRLLRLLITLGFDADVWKKSAGRPFSQEFPKALRAMPGMRFKAKKATNESKGKTYHNLYPDARLPDGKPDKFGPAELNAAADEFDPDNPFGD